MMDTSLLFEKNSYKGGKVSLWAAPELRRFRDRLLTLTEGDIRNAPGTEIIKENKHRTIYKVRLPFFPDPLIVKSYRFPTLNRTLKGVLGMYGKRELAHAREAARRDIPVADPLFLLRREKRRIPRECLFACRYLEGRTLYEVLCETGGLDSERLSRLLRTAGRLTALLHDKGGIHRDYHAGNLLVLGDATIVLLDLYSLTFVKSLREKDRVEGLAGLTASILPFVGSSGLDEVLKGYREAALTPLNEGARNGILKAQTAMRRRHEVSRAKRCMVNSSAFYQYRDSEVRIAARRELSVAEIRSILEAFDRDFRMRSRDALKNAPESVILRHEKIWKRPLCVKWYRKRGRADRAKEWLRGGRVLRAWKAGNGLLARGIPAATPYAMVKTRRGGFLLMEAVKGVELDRFADRLLHLKGDGEFSTKRAVAEHLGRLIGEIHGKGIYHADLKACNVMVQDEDGLLALKLLDYDHVGFYRKIPEKFLLKNLAQLNTSVPRGVSRTLRLRFLRAYRAAYPEAPEVKALFGMVWRESRGKPIVYVTDHGDRIESWRF